MARPRSDEKQDAILAAATRIISAQGLSAPTTLIAKEAGISTGSLFTYFPTKTDLLNRLFVDLKVEMASSALEGLATKDDARSQLAHMWAGWVQWATSHPDKRRALAQLTVSDEISPQSRQIANRAMADIAGLLDRSRGEGILRSAPLGFVAGLLNAVADATVDYIILDPDNAETHRATGFDALWRLIS